MNYGSINVRIEDIARGVVVLTIDIAVLRYCENPFRLAELADNLRESVASIRKNLSEVETLLELTEAEAA